MRKSLVLITTVFAMFLLLPLVSCQQSSDAGTSFKKESSSETGAEQPQNWIIFYTLTEAAEYISNLTESGTYYIKIVDDNTSGVDCYTCGLKDALKKLDKKDINIYLDLSEINITFYCEDLRVGTALVGIILPSNLEYVADQLFYECTKLEYVVLPESITRILNDAFTGCSSLKTITIPKSVTEIEYYAFRNCSSLTTINIEHEDGKVWGHPQMPGGNGRKISPTKDDIIVFDCFLDNIVYLLTNNGTLKCKGSCCCSDDCDCTSLNSEYTTMSYYYYWYKVDS